MAHKTLSCQTSTKQIRENKLETQHNFGATVTFLVFTPNHRRHLQLEQLAGLAHHCFEKKSTAAAPGDDRMVMQKKKNKCMLVAES